MEIHVAAAPMSHAEIPAMEKVLFRAQPEVTQRNLPSSLDKYKQKRMPMIAMPIPVQGMLLD